MGSQSGLKINTKLFFNCGGRLNFTKKDGENYIEQAEKAYKTIKKGDSNLLYDKNTLMTGWINLPENYLSENSDFLGKIKQAAEKFTENIDAYISVGTGGSYLGLEAGVNAILPDYYNLLSRNERRCPEVYFAGNHMDSDSIFALLKCLHGKQIGINVISKSGTTTETAVAFRILKNFIKQNQCAPEKFIILTTNKTSGALQKLIKENDFNSHFFDDKTLEKFHIPNDIGGRFSVTSPVGLFGLAAAGIDIHAFISGAYEMQKIIHDTQFDENPAFIRAALRTGIQDKTAKIENIVSAQKSLYGLSRWSRQLWAESEGKREKGMWVSHGFYTEDAHSIGQLISDGPKNITETFLTLEKPENEIPIPRDKKANDGIGHLSNEGKNVSFINECAIKGLKYDHYKKNVPVFEYIFPEINAFVLGQYFQCEMNACLISCLMQGLNGVTQPGVEGYKKAMFALSGKPGYEEERKEILDYFDDK